MPSSSSHFRSHYCHYCHHFHTIITIALTIVATLSLSSSLSYYRHYRFHYRRRYRTIVAIAPSSLLSHSLSLSLSHYCCRYRTIVATLSLLSSLSHYCRSALVALIFILLTLFSRYVLEDPILAPTEHPIAIRDLTPVSVCCLLHAQRAVSIINAQFQGWWKVEPRRG